MLRKTMVGLILLVSLGVPVWGRPAQERGQEKRLERQQSRQQKGARKAVRKQRLARRQGLKSQLNLSDDQTAQLKSLRQSRRQELNRIRQLPDQNQRRSELKAVREKFLADTRAILTPDQQRLLQRRERALRKK